MGGLYSSWMGGAQEAAGEKPSDGWLSWPGFALLIMASFLGLVTAMSPNPLCQLGTGPGELWAVAPASIPLFSVFWLSLAKGRAVCENHRVYIRSWCH